MDTTGAGDGFLGGFLHYFVKSGADCCESSVTASLRFQSSH